MLFFSINHVKAPGPEGMSALFFQKFWPDIEEQVVKEVQEFFCFWETSEGVELYALMPYSKNP